MSDLQLILLNPVPPLSKLVLPSNPIYTLYVKWYSSNHSRFSTTVMQSFSDVYPHLRTATDVPTLVKIADVNWDEVDAAFCCLPHATTQETLAQLPNHIKIVDLSADFRLRNVDTYAEWYDRTAPHDMCLSQPSTCMANAS